MENLVEYYYNVLKTSKNPAATVGEFYSKLLDRSFGRSEIIAFNKLIKLFGRFYVFTAIIDLARIELKDGFPYGLIFKICKDRFESTFQSEMTTASYENLDKRLVELQKEIESTKEISPEGFLEE